MYATAKLMAEDLLLGYALFHVNLATDVQCFICASQRHHQPDVDVKPKHLGVYAFSIYGLTS